eukprot:245895_1
MSHTFPNLQAHPTLTPNPTFQPQPLPLPLPMPQPPPSQNLPSQPPHSIGSVAPSHQSPMQFLPRQHYATAPLPLNTNLTPEYTTNTLNGSHPPPLTHENDINTSTSNDESTERTDTATNNANHSAKNGTSTHKKSSASHKTEKKNSEKDAHADEDIENNGEDTTDTPFGRNYNDNQPQIQQTVHAFASPFAMQHNAPHDERKHNAKQQYFATNLVPSPFTMHSQPNYEYHDSHTEKPRNILLIPPNQPMFGHHNAYSMRADSYLSRNYGEAQQMVDVPHVQPQSDDVLPEIVQAENENHEHEAVEEHPPHEDNDQNETRRNKSGRRERERIKKKRKLRKRKKDRNRREDIASKYESIKEQASTHENGNANTNIEGSVKGGAGNGYRMVLDEPVNKSMLSCHQCKNKKTLDRIIVCGHVYRINNTVKTCTKKYCKSCLLRFYLEAPPTDNQDPTWSSWKCPCCRYICCCAWCRKKKAKRLESVSNAIRAEAHRLTPAISLARKLVSESRVNNSNGDNSNSKKKRHTD